MAENYFTPPPYCYLAIVKTFNKVFLCFMIFFLIFNYLLSDPPTPCSWDVCLDENNNPVPLIEELSPITVNYVDTSAS